MQLPLPLLALIALSASTLAYPFAHPDPAPALPEPILRSLQGSALGQREYFDDVRNLVAKDEAGRDVPAGLGMPAVAAMRQREGEYFDDVPVRKG
ncbi:hypothetical protein CALCODRAFT_498216 [Calocera cornea HHB12733]|uniref:Uncharacterized protein n=1 Tax=Calocera cornea HHB12733 TaxID=1353952 RepID=A0A165EXV0_9BASI|nr:hypothetical protein CALCODRAFT_498216 [Calocera cornea HHB12733]